MTKTTRPLCIIAQEIQKEIKEGRWAAQSRFYAMPYLKAMLQFSDISENYGADSAKSVVLYFLSNAGTWRGEAAKRIKAELKELVK